MIMDLPPGHVAMPLYDAIGPEAFAVVADWLRAVASEHALETHPDGRVLSPSVTWLAEAVSFYDPEVAKP